MGIWYLIFEWMYTYDYIWIYVCIYICIRVCTYTHIYTYTWQYSLYNAQKCLETAFYMMLEDVGVGLQIQII